ncbi:MAG: FAD-dependent oxidoreductase [Candidatus Hodgkinia cicadicola]
MIAFEKLVIIGSGPAGYTAAIYAASSLLEPLIISGPLPGGQLVGTEQVENFPGFPKGISGFKLMKRMRAQALRLGARISTDSVVDVDTSSLPFHMLMASGKIYIANCVIIATGREHKTLNVEGEQDLIGKGITACAACDSFSYRRKDVVVVGGGSTAVAAALRVSRIAKQVTLVCRARKLVCKQALKARLVKSGNVCIMYSARVVKYISESVGSKLRLSSVRIKQGNCKTLLKTSDVFLAIGCWPRTEAFKTIKKNRAGYIVTKSNSNKTSVEGIFAAGDVTKNSCKLAITAADAGCRAAIEAEDFLCA